MRQLCPGLALYFRAYALADCKYLKVQWLIYKNLKAGVSGSQSLRAATQPGFLSSQRENSFHQGKWRPGERVLYLVGQKTRLDYDPQGLGSKSPEAMTEIQLKWKK